MLVFWKGKLVGADPFGVCLDGHYTECEGGGYLAKIRVAAPPGGTLIQGVVTGPSGVIYEVDAHLPENLEKPDFVGIHTPFMPINVRFKKLRGLSDE